MGAMTRQKLLICILNKVLIKRPRSKQKPVINRSIELVDGRIDVEIISK